MLRIFEYMRILQTRTTDCLKLPSYFLRTVRNKTTKIVENFNSSTTLETYQFSTFNFMYKVCVYILYEGHLSLCINIIQTNFTVLYSFGCRYINKLARRNVAIFVCFVHTYCICIIAFLAFPWLAECSEASFLHILS